MSWPGFLVGGDYARYVWGSYGLTLIAMGGEVLLLRRRRARRSGSFQSTIEHTEHTGEKKNRSSR